MAKYSVKQLADLAGVSVRTLHHYDQINLLKPSYRSEKGYRFYERNELLMLQQILLYRELGFSLHDIDSIINDPSFNITMALETHKKNLKKQLENLKQLISTVDKTLNDLKNKTKMADSDIYEGFNAEEIRARKRDVAERWGKSLLKETEERIRIMGKEGWQDTKKKGEEINLLLVRLMDLPPDDVNVQKAIELHFRHMNLFYEISKDKYLGLGKMYVEDERFNAMYEKYRAGLANFIYEAIQVFCRNNLTV